jgi:mono/diheme cytochrome c family protein
MTSKKLIATIAAGGTALAIALGGASMDVVASAPASSAHAAAAKTQKKKESRGQKLAKALKACKKQKSKAKRKACEKAAHKKYNPVKKPKHEKEPEEEKTTGTGTGTGTTTGTGATTTTGTGATTTTGTGATTTTGTTGTTKPTTAEVAQGKTLFETTCKSCHGMDGKGVTGIAPAYGPELPRSESIMGVVEQLTNPINEKPVKMPNYNSMYSTAEKEALGAYIAVEFTHKATAH